MPKYFCEYCGIFLTQSSPKSRKEHVLGKKHVQSKVEYYTRLLYEKSQEGELNDILNAFVKKGVNKKFHNKINIESLSKDRLEQVNIPGINESSINYINIPGSKCMLKIKDESINKKVKDLIFNQTQANQEVDIKNNTN